MLISSNANRPNMAYFKHLFIIHSSFIFSFKKYVLPSIMLRTLVETKK